MGDPDGSSCEQTTRANLYSLTPRNPDLPGRRSAEYGKNRPLLMMI